MDLPRRTFQRREGRPGVDWGGWRRLEGRAPPSKHVPAGGLADRGRWRVRGGGGGQCTSPSAHSCGGGSIQGGPAWAAWDSPRRTGDVATTVVTLTAVTTVVSANVSVFVRRMRRPSTRRQRQHRRHLRHRHHIRYRRRRYHRRHRHHPGTAGAA